MIVLTSTSEPSSSSAAAFTLSLMRLNFQTDKNYHFPLKSIFFLKLPPGHGGELPRRRHHHQLPQFHHLKNKIFFKYFFFKK